MGIRYAVNELFFDIWTPEMAYTLGFWYADGSMEFSPSIRGKYIRVSSTDYDRIELFRTLLNSQHNIIVRTHPDNKKTQYLLRIGNAKLYDSLSIRGVAPHKSLTMKFPTVPDALLSDFVRGYFDGDGCVFLEKQRGLTQEKIVKRLLVVFTSGSKDFLTVLNTTLASRLGTQLRPFSQNGRNSYQLRYGTKDSVAIFRLLYTDTSPPLYLSRKYDIFAEYFNLRPIRVDSKIAQILKYQNGLVAK